MSAPTCSTCGTTMEYTDSIGARGYYCPNVTCTLSSGPKTILRFHGGVRGLTVCYFDALRPPSCCGQEMIWEVLRASYVCGSCGSAR